MKFEEAYCKKLDITCTINEAANIFKTNPQRFSNDYQFDLWCPECGAARLMFNNDKPPYFRAYKHSIHIECSLTQAEISSKEAERFVQILGNESEIQRQMDSVLLRLFTPREAALRKSSKTDHERSLEKEAPEKKDVSPTKRLSPKRVDCQFKDTDFDCYKAFYGYVMLDFGEGTETDNKGVETVTDDFSFLIIKDIDSEKELCRVKITKKVKEKLPPEYFDGFPYTARIVFVAIMRRKKSFSVSLRRYSTRSICSLRWSTRLKIIKD